MISALFTLAPKRSALRLAAVTGRPSRDTDMLCLAVAVFVERTLHSLAGYICVFRRNIDGASHALPALPEAGAAGISGMA